MTCTHPIHGFRAPGGQVKFSRKGAWVDRPVTVPCGQCSSCRLERSRQWALRCVHEAELHERNCFITLTYDEEHLPFDGSLDVSHWQKFAKRLRRECGPFRFLHCGEYGDRNFRPHYHACVFGQDFRSDSYVFKRKEGYDVRVSPKLNEVWGKGFCTVSDLVFKSAAYVARYVMNKVGGPEADEHYRRLDPVTGEEFIVKREYVTMSRRPGLGAKWIEKFHEDVYPVDRVWHDGKFYRPPVFYDNAVARILDPSFLDAVKRVRAKNALKHAEDQTPDRLYIRSLVTDARLSQLPRDI